MKVVVAMDSFKGSLSSLEAGQAVKEGILRIIPDAKVCVRPLADGGEGTVEALIFGMGGTIENIKVTGPLGKMINCSYGILNLDKNVKKAKTAVIEMASAAGITLISENEKNPLNTTTYGVGEMIKDAISKGCRNFVIGIGGSATNDGGAGMLQALGYELLDKDGRQIPFGAKGLKNLVKIEEKSVIPELRECNFRIACDVTNPLYGKLGCSAVFGPQKGADEDMIKQMDEWLANYAKLTRMRYKKANENYPGAGAAGGLGFAFLSYTNAKLESGSKIVLEETNIERDIAMADMVITGEGKLDGQTIFGKAPIGVAKLAKKNGKTVIAFSGCVVEDAVVCNEYGIDAFFPILRKIETLEEAMETENAKENLRTSVEQVFRIITTQISY